MDNVLLKFYTGNSSSNPNIYSWTPNDNSYPLFNPDSNLSKSYNFPFHNSYLNYDTFDNPSFENNVFQTTGNMMFQTPNSYQLELLEDRIRKLELKRKFGNLNYQNQFNQNYQVNQVKIPNNVPINEPKFIYEKLFNLKPINENFITRKKMKNPYKNRKKNNIRYNNNNYNLNNDEPSEMNLIVDSFKDLKNEIQNKLFEFEKKHDEEFNELKDIILNLRRYEDDKNTEIEENKTYSNNISEKENLSSKSNIPSKPSSQISSNKLSFHDDSEKESRDRKHSIRNHKSNFNKHYDNEEINSYKENDNYNNNNNNGNENMKKEEMKLILSSEKDENSNNISSFHDPSEIESRDRKHTINTLYYKNGNMKNKQQNVLPIFNQDNKLQNDTSKKENIASNSNSQIFEDKKSENKNSENVNSDIRQNSNSQISNNNKSESKNSYNKSSNNQFSNSKNSSGKISSHMLSFKDDDENKSDNRNHEILFNMNLKKNNTLNKKENPINYNEDKKSKNSNSKKSNILSFHESEEKKSDNRRHRIFFRNIRRNIQTQNNEDYNNNIEENNNNYSQSVSQNLNFNEQNLNFNGNNGEEELLIYEGEENKNEEQNNSN
jgi:hypothetical protein